MPSRLAGSIWLSVAEPGELRAVSLAWRPLGAGRPLLDGIDLKVAAGERVLLAGASGAGKSTLLRAFAGVLEDHAPGELSGEVTVGGLPAAAGRSDVGLVSQQPFDSVVAESVGRDTAFGPENLGLPRPKIHDRVSEALGLVGFPYGPQHSTGALSGGQAQRLALAGVLAMSPRVILLDEAGAMLDAPSAGQLRAAVDDICARIGATLVVADHDIAGWTGIVERLVVIDAGRVIADGPLQEVLESHDSHLLELGLWVPGAPDPEPTEVLLGADRPGGHGEAVASAQRVVADRTPPLTLRSVQRDPSVRVLDGVDMELRAGELVALQGDSGAGKSTLLSVLLGALPVVAGEVRVRDGDDPARLTSRELAAWAGWVPQFAESLMVGDTVLSCLTVTALALGQPQEQLELKALRLLAAVGLEGLEERHPLSLSGGEQRRLAVICAVLHGPAMLLADEPTVGLDRLAWAAVAGVLLEARKAGSGVLVATHDASLVRLTDRQVHLEPVGQVTQQEQGGRSQANPGRPGPASLLERAGPLSLLLGAIMLTVSGLFTKGVMPLGGGVAALVIVGMLLLRFRFPLRWLAPPVIAVVSVAWSNWLLSDPRAVEPALVAALRVAFIVLPGVVAASFLDPTALGDHLGGRLRLPARPVLAVVAALRRLDRFAVLWQEMAQARRVRGIGPGKSLTGKAREWGALCLVLLVESVRQAGRLTIAMDSRGYLAPGPRTWLGESAWTRYDSCVVAVAGVLAAVPHLLTLLN